LPQADGRHRPRQGRRRHHPQEVGLQHRTERSARLRRRRHRALRDQLLLRGLRTRCIEKHRHTEARNTSNSECINKIPCLPCFRGEYTRSELFMPHVQITMLTGRTIEQKRRIVQRLTELLCEELQAKPEAVVITLVEVPRENYARGGVLKADRKANSP